MTKEKYKKYYYCSRCKNKFYTKDSYMYKDNTPVSINKCNDCQDWEDSEGEYELNEKGYPIVDEDDRD